MAYYRLTISDAQQTSHDITEQYIKQLNRIKQFQEQDVTSGRMPDAQELVNMNPEQAQKVVGNFMTKNNISNGKQFAALYRNAARADIQQIRQEAQNIQQQNPEEFEKMKQQASANRGKSFFELASGRYKDALHSMSILMSLVFSVIFAGTSGALDYTLTTTIPFTLASGWGALGGIVFMIARMMAGDKNMAPGEMTNINKIGQFASKGMMVASIGLVCCCAIRWIYKFLTNPKKNAKTPIVNKVQFAKELGGDAVANNIKQRRTQTAEGYITETVLCLNEGLISYVKNKVVNYLKTTWNYLKILVSTSGLSKWFKRILTFLTIGVIIVFGYFRVPINAVVTM